MIFWWGLLAGLGLLFGLLVVVLFAIGIWRAGRDQGYERGIQVGYTLGRRQAADAVGRKYLEDPSGYLLGFNPIEVALGAPDLEAAVAELTQNWEKP